MQFSESWLRSLCNPPISTETLCHLLTMAGLEVEDITKPAPPFSDVVVAQVLSTEKHPDADKLKLCRVDIGHGEPLQIVCGAPNVAAGMKIPCARVGAKLPGIEIKQAKVRGIESFGMLCSARELGLGDDHGGLLQLADDAVVGTSIREQLDLDDTLITLKLTPNRADCLSLFGIAREVSALTGTPLTLVDTAPVAATHDARRTIVLDAADACPRYCGRIVQGVNSAAATPQWMKQRIERSGVRSISALVDITNYVMLELGQPLHAFDNAQLAGTIRVRYPTSGESLVLLNGQNITPTAETALITDDQKALALAGIMGGEQSGIAGSTTDLFLESAFFVPSAIAGKARALGFSTDASHRYERGVDFELPAIAIERATALILQVCGGKPGPTVEAVAGANLPQRPAVKLRTARADKVIGVALGAERIEQILRGLGLAVSRDGKDFFVTPPSFRFDMTIEEDLIEELARVYGYENIPTAPPVARMSMMPSGETTRTAMQLRRIVAERDFHEVVTYSFVESAWEKDFGKQDAPISLANPIAAQMSTMRSTLIGGLIGALISNRKRQTERVRIFEVGRCFLRTNDSSAVTGFEQPLRLGMLAYGPNTDEQWGLPKRAVDFFDLKADVEAILGADQMQHMRFEKAEHPALHPGRCANVLIHGKLAGVIGELHPRWVQKYELGTAPVIFETDLDALLAAKFPEYSELSRQPAVTRDIALVVAQSQPVQTLLDALKAVAPPIVSDIYLFDLYQGKGLEIGQKSLAFRIVMQDTQRTLEDAEVEAAVANLLSVAASDFGAHLRA
jgi:phenylalanyl-tRNA synthetase beta chain